MRHSQQKGRLLDPAVIDGFERRCSSSASNAKEPLREILELRAIARELISHINALEEARAK